MVTTWEERMPKRHPEGVMFGLTQAQCMLMEITELRAENKELCAKLAEYESREPYGYVSEHNCFGPHQYQFHFTAKTVYPDNYLGVKNES